jgi:hypothetical protein
VDCVTGGWSNASESYPDATPASHSINRNRRSTSNITLSGVFGRFGRATDATRARVVWCAGDIRL